MRSYLGLNLAMGLAVLSNEACFSAAFVPPSKGAIAFSDLLLQVSCDACGLGRHEQLSPQILSITCLFLRVRRFVWHKLDRSSTERQIKSKESSGKKKKP